MSTVPNMFEVDCPYCEATNFKSMKTYTSGDIVVCFNCSKVFTEYE